MKWLGLFTAVVVVLAAYIAVFSTTIRYRLTLEAEVDGEPRTGSGVIEVSYSKNNDPISSAEFPPAFAVKPSFSILVPEGRCLRC